ncbi:MAG: hypothetical protein QOF89_6122 [Acidobacteriota bacterium]|jgi:hypothetical protein|nr:hypothetical protein [Acidobacteriota bacterium]
MKRANDLRAIPGRRRVSCGLLWALLFLLAGAVPAVARPAGGSALAFGLQHTALGQAELKTSGHRLTIGNLGSSGEDGVAIDLGEAGGWDGHWAEIDTRGLPVGAFLRTSLTATVDGKAGSPVASTEVRNANGQVVLRTDFSRIGSTLRFDFFRLGKLVDTWTGQPGDTALIVNGGMTRDAHYSMIGTGEPCSTPGYPCLFAGYTFGGGSSAALIVGVKTPVDEIRVYPEEARVKQVGGRAQVAIRLAGIRQLTLTDEALVAFALSHHAEDGTAFAAKGGTLTLADDGGPGRDGSGVAIDLGMVQGWQGSIADIGDLAAGGVALESSMVGRVDGVDDRTIGSGRLRSDGSSARLAIDFGRIGSQTQKVELLGADGTLIGSFEQPDNTVMIVNQCPGGFFTTVCTWLWRCEANGDSGWVQWCHQVCVTGPDGTNYPNVALMRVTAQGITSTRDFVSGATLRQKGLESLTLTGEARQPMP